ncbi:MAG: hypothetical protein J5995_04180 [Muribaculaceae bacterium]|nr:hypothetical protein [Muribaculaceae bacterium]
MIKKFFTLMLAPLLLAACTSENDPETGVNHEDGQQGESPEWMLTTRLDLTSGEEGNMNVLNEFGYRLMAETQASSANGEFCVSPLSVSVYLGMFANATSGDVHNEILDAIGIDGIEGFNTLNEKLMHYLPCDENGSSIDIANRFWVKDIFKVPDAFGTLVSNVFNADVEYVDFTDSSTVPSINRWVSDRTRGKIPALLDGDWEKYVDLNMASANTVYFKGDWQSMFDPDDSFTGQFRGKSGISDVRMMRKSLPAGYAENGNVRMVTLDFSGYANAMELYLPSEGTDICDLASVLTAKSCAELRESVRTYDVAVTLPAFKKSDEPDLLNILAGMGIKSLENADFAPMGLGVLHATLIHKTSVKIDERGAELAAVTGGIDLVLPPETADYPKMKIDFDRPFLYIVRNIKTGAILMAGAVTEI